MRSLYYFLFIFILLFCIQCNKDSSPNINYLKPIIEEISLHYKWNIESLTPYRIEVKVIDPQGISDKNNVLLTVNKIGYDQGQFIDTLYDDASFYHPQDGDIVAGDGVYSNRFLSTDIAMEDSVGEYIFSFIVQDEGGNFSENIDTTIIFNNNWLPAIISVTYPVTFLSGFREEIIWMVVRDNDGMEDIEESYFEVKTTNLLTTVFKGILYNDGLENHGDQVEGDSIFTVKLDSTFGAGKGGQYKLLFYVEDSYQENYVFIPDENIIIENREGRLISVTMPSSMGIPSNQGTYNRELLTVSVNDPQGLGDVDSVYFYSLKPDSTYANNGLPFMLVDNGLSFNINTPLVEVGDLARGDGIYSFSILVYNNTNPGIYTFTFYMGDKANNRTEGIVRNILIE